MRGIAALAIAALHTSVLSSSATPRQYFLAVDFFFLLSGFVIAHAYGERLDRGLPLATFLKARFVRLYPLYLLGLLFGVASVLLRAHMGQDTYSAKIFLPQSLLNGLLGIPSLLGFLTYYAFPLNIPAWSLFGEIVANVLHACFLRRRSTTSLLILTSICGLLFVLLLLLQRTADYGSRSSEILTGLPRVLFSYILGILIHRWWTRHRSNLRLPALLPPILLLCMLAQPYIMLHRSAYDAAVIFLGMPLLLALSARVVCGHILRPAAHLLGLLSYPLYILHSPLVDIALTLQQHYHLPLSHRLWLLAIVTVTLAAFAAELLYDRPLRAFLRSRLHA
jgi:peptidoglycan/LPS O-acetylase OafA/YrhL